MLYNTELYGTKKDEFIFDEQPYNEDIDVRKIASIQKFYEQNGYIPSENIEEFLNWITYRARKNVCHPAESPLYASLAGRCGPTQSFNDVILGKMGMTKMAFNVGTVLGKEKIHALECVQIPTLQNGQIVNRLFILDPTFRQFCLAEENRFERYYEEPRWAVRMSSPHPGYFLNLTEKGRTFANNLIHYGYFEVTEENLKTYFDSFSLYTTPKEAYQNPEYIGKISETTATGTDYWNRIISCIEYPLPLNYKMDLDTPKEIVNKEDRKLLNRFKNTLLHQKKQEEYNIGYLEEQQSNKTI